MNRLYLEYSDTGKGIASENVEKIFEPFFTTHRAQGGSGLGMYICYNLVTTQLQGTITCESTDGKGVKFSIIAFPDLVKDKIPPNPRVLILRCQEVHFLFQFL